MVKDPFQPKLLSTGNFGMTKSKASRYMAAAMWSLRSQIITCLKNKMLQGREMTKLLSQFIIRMFGLRTMYVTQSLQKLASKKDELTKFLAFQLID